MLSNALAFYGCMALLLIIGVNTQRQVTGIAENCQERINECMNIGTHDEEIIFQNVDIAECLKSFVCKDSEDDLRMKAIFEYGRTMSMGEEVLFQDRFDRTRPSNLAVIISVSYRTLIISSVTAFLLA